MNMQEDKVKTKWALAGAVVAAVTASLCCILPVIAVGLGLTGFAASRFFEAWRPYFLAATAGLLALGFYRAYRPRQEACETGSVCERTPLGRWNRLILWLATLLVIVVAAFPYYSGWAVRAVAKEKQPAVLGPLNSQAHLVIQVEGMDCPACAGLLQENLRQLPGVRRAEVSFQDKQAIIDYDPKTVDPSRFERIIADAGFRATPPGPANN
jgi:mercuric ion transport protein